MKTKDKEILSSCCAFSSDGLEEVHVLESDCPINREDGKRIVKPFREGETERAECTCVFASIFGGGVNPCEHYQGYKKVQRDKRPKYKVLCDAIEK